MKKVFFWFCVFAGVFVISAQGQYLTVTTPSNCVTDGSGAALASGTMIVVGTDANDNPIPYRAGTSVMATTAPISRTITNGQLATSLQLADPASTSPLNVLYRFAIKDNNTQKITLYKQIVIVNNDSGNFNFCKMNPLPFTTQVQFASAPFSFSGDWHLLGNLQIDKSTQLCENTVTFSATPTFNAGICNGFKITLTANVTSSTLSGALIGEPIFIEVCQDATGGRTFVAPTNVTGFVAPSTTANACTLQMFWYDGTNAVHDASAQPFTNSAGLAAMLSDESGTGVVVFGTSPTITTPNINGGIFDVINQKASTTFLLKDNTGGTRFSIPSGGSTPSTLNNTDVTGSSTLTSISFKTGVSQGSGLKHQRFASLCSTAATVGATCTSTLTWTSAFADANYTITCSGITGSNNAVFEGIESIAAATFVIRILQPTTASAASFTTVDCIAMHD
jgi:hypothetical protein